MDNIKVGMLLDCYGELLTERQRLIVEQSVYDDCSLAEIAEREGISRQGVRDILKRAEDQLINYELVLGLSKKRQHVSERLSNLQSIVKELPASKQRTEIIDELASILGLLEE